ncbi:phage baseplate protein [Veronia pacifica]|uniref:Phage baseplate protein n=1 Tax=Veronia pacifica TaxID=1080227 RepID=A0A1C3E9L5_9GAMM|nr:phage baseplate protein [Veronia pacifica]ODA29859.1 phage baseplate protein [Veronia pacifica]
MIAIDPESGRTVTGEAALLCRFKKILTTVPTSRAKRREVGNRALSLLGKRQTPTTAMIVQNLTLEALSLPVNGLTEFTATRCQANPTKTGFEVAVYGIWQGRTLTLTGAL